MLNQDNSAQHAAFEKWYRFGKDQRLDGTIQYLYSLFQLVTSDELSDLEYLNSHSEIPEESVTGGNKAVYFSFFLAPLEQTVDFSEKLSALHYFSLTQQATYGAYLL